MMSKFANEGPGIVAAGHPSATLDGLNVLKKGGNAFDAAVCAAATLAIVAPHECGLGGDLFAVVATAKGERLVLNASGRAPARATLARYSSGIPATGPLSVSVPGMVGGWSALHKRFGSRPLAELFEPAIAHARTGFSLTDVFVQNIVERKPVLLANEPSTRLFLDQSSPKMAGEVIKQPAAANTLASLARDGADAFYRGAIADAVAGELEAAGGILSADDLAGFSPVWQEPLSTTFCGTEVCVPPPNSWAAALLLQLATMEREGVPKDDLGLFVNGMLARQSAYQRLSGHIADPETVGDRARQIVTNPVSSPESGGTLAEVSSDTSQVVVADSHGNVVSLLQSISVPFGSGLYLEETGVILNNRLAGFSTKEGDPNCLAPNKRPAHTLAPALALRDGKVHLACATPGGPGQTGSIAQFMARYLARGETLTEAIDAPRWSVNQNGDWLIEDTAGPELFEQIRRVLPGAVRVPWGGVFAGSVAAVAKVGNGWVGAADRRRDASVLSV